MGDKSIMINGRLRRDQLPPFEPDKTMDRIQIVALIRECETIIKIMQDAQMYFEKYLEKPDPEMMVVTTNWVTSPYRGFGCRVHGGIHIECDDGIHFVYDSEIKDIRYPDREKEMQSAMMAGVKVEA